MQLGAGPGKRQDAGTAGFPSGLVFTLALIFGLLLNEANLSWVKSHNRENLRMNGRSHVGGYTIWSVDNYWYLTQIENLLGGRGFTLEPENPRMAVRRAPGYPLFWGFHRVLFGRHYAFAAVRYSQLLLFALSAVLLGRAVLDLCNDQGAAVLAALGWAVSPFAAIYAYYTVTEALYPALTIFAFAAFARAIRTGRAGWFGASGVILGALSLTRPVCGLLVPALLLAILFRSRPWTRAALRQGVWRSMLLVSGLVMVLLPWGLRNWLVTGDFVLLEAHYGRMINLGRAHTAFWDWWAAWGNPADQDYTHDVLTSLAGPHPQEAAERVERLAATLPAAALAGTSREEVRERLLALNTCLLLQLRREQDASPCDERVETAFRDLTVRFRRAAPLQYFLFTPMRNLRGLLLQSFSAAFASLNPPDRQFTPLQVAAKGSMYLLNLGLWASLVVLPFLPGLPAELKIVTLGFVGLTLGFLLWVGRMVEGRYVLQLHPLLNVALALGLASAWRWASPAVEGTATSVGPIRNPE